MSTGDAFFALSSPILSLTESLDLSTELGHIASYIKMGISKLSDKIDKKIFFEKLEEIYN